MNVLIWTYLIRYISITKKVKKQRGKTYFKRNDNTKQHRWKSREIKVIFKTKKDQIPQQSVRLPMMVNDDVTLAPPSHPYISWMEPPPDPATGGGKQTVWQIDARVYRKVNGSDGIVLKFYVSFCVSFQCFAPLYFKAAREITSRNVHPR